MPRHLVNLKILAAAFITASILMLAVAATNSLHHWCVVKNANFGTVFWTAGEGDKWHEPTFHDCIRMLGW